MDGRGKEIPVEKRQLRERACQNVTDKLVVAIFARLKVSR